MAPEKRLKIAAIAICMVAAIPASAQQDDRDPDDRDASPEAREAYRRGYERGFDRGYRKGLDEGERRGASLAPPPPPPAPPPPRLGPIRVTGAHYGTYAKNCDATRYVSRRANGKKSHSFTVTNEICGDPAPSDRKSLEVSYLCGEIGKTASSREHRVIYLDCSS